jgi:hypothetical protein
MSATSIRAVVVVVAGADVVDVEVVVAAVPPQAAAKRARAPTSAINGRFIASFLSSQRSVVNLVLNSASVKEDDKSIAMY